MSNNTKQKPSKHYQSIARSLNLSFFGSLFSTFVLFNMAFILIIGYLSLLSAESQINLYQKQLQVINNNIFISPIESGEITFNTEVKKPTTYIMNELLRPSYLPDVVYRRVRLGPDFDFGSISTYDNISYHVQILKNDQYITFTYAMNRSLQPFLVIYFTFIMIQGFMLISAIFKQSRKIKRSLHPLNTLVASTKDLQKDISNLAVSVDTKQLKSIAQAIEKIDAQKLDKQLSVSQSSGEYIELTAAINDMLIRINQAVALQTQFVSNASHELRTPISVIQGYINLLDRWGKDDPATLQESIIAIKNETENMKTLVENLLFLARGDSDNIQLVLESIDTHFLLEEVIKETSMIDSQRNIELVCDETVSLVADRQLIKQALRILLDNAMKYSDLTTPIIIRCAKEEQRFICSITDQGIGISPENIERVFDRFYRDEHARVAKAKGAGLGLSIAKWIVEKHQGTIEIVSRKDIGTKVIINLPLFNR
jgi:two-component system, OmpR family, sensor histidine kinase ArlS